MTRRSPWKSRRIPVLAAPFPEPPEARGREGERKARRFERSVREATPENRDAAFRSDHPQARRTSPCHVRIMRVRVPAATAAEAGHCRDAGRTTTLLPRPQSGRDCLRGGQGARLSDRDRRIFTANSPPSGGKFSQTWQKNHAAAGLAVLSVAPVFNPLGPNSGVT